LERKDQWIICWEYQTTGIEAVLDSTQLSSLSSLAWTFHRAVEPSISEKTKSETGSIFETPG
jgi:hypothetical protein